MKTSVIEVDDMLSVLSVGELEKRMDEVPGVESTTVNFDARSATVRYDETRLEISDIKSAVRQRAYDSASPNAGSAGGGHKDHTAPAGPPGPPASGAPKPVPNAAAAGAAPAPDKAAPSTIPKPSSGAPPAAAATVSTTPSPDAAAAGPTHPKGHEQPDKTAPTKT